MAGDGGGEIREEQGSQSVAHSEALGWEDTGGQGAQTLTSRFAFNLAQNILIVASEDLYSYFSQDTLLLHCVLFFL